MWMQNFTTNEPDDSMIEVAIEAMKLVLCRCLSHQAGSSSLGAACDHIDHVRTQLPYALLAAAVSIILWIVVALVGGAA